MVDLRVITLKCKTTEQVSASLVRNGCAIYQIAPDLVRTGERVRGAAQDFFSKTPAEKAHSSAAGCLEGYLEFGAERDKITGRPDLSESYRVWHRNQPRPDVKSWAADCLLHREMVAAYEPFVGLANDILETLYRAVAEPLLKPTAALDLHSASYLQLNYSRPSEHARDTITDLHEDGHLLTIIRPFGPGLAGAPGALVDVPNREQPAGRFRSSHSPVTVDLNDDEVLVIASSPTYFLTGGLTPPYFHLVQTSGLSSRLSLVFFVNPGRHGTLAPWRECDASPVRDIHAVIDAVSYAHNTRHDWKI